jgi:molecular chaperone Hsp33
MTDDGSFRVVSVDATRTARAIIAAQNAEAADARHLAELVVGAVLFRETMAPDLRAQCVLHGAQNTGRIAVDAHPEGKTRGIVARPKTSPEVELGEGARLEMLRTLPQQRGHRGVVEFPPGGTVSKAVMEYMQVSEQIVTMVSISARFQGATLSRAIGYLVQLTPETLPEPLRVMTERLPAFESIDARADDPATSPRSLVGELLEGLAHEVTAEVDVEFFCNCSEDRVLASLGTLPRADVRELLSGGTPIELSCDYCGTSYKVSEAQLRALMDRS